MYCLTIIICVILIMVLNIVFRQNFSLDSILNIVKISLISFLAVVLVDAVFATICRWVLPKKWVTEDKTFYCGGSKERRFYEKIGIKKWKDKIIELGIFTKFRKNKIYDPHSIEYVKRYIIELNYAVLVHFSGCIAGFLILFIYTDFLLTITLPIALCNVFFNFLSLAIVRYNLPKLHMLYKLNLKKQEMKQNDK